MDWLPFDDGAIRINLTCGRRSDGHWYGTLSIGVRAEALRTYGLHPDQPWSGALASPQPAWWRAEALRLMLHSDRHRRSRRPAI
ncbi:MAG: hypothetical protein HOV87_33885 [Catenulispora sp.]|nr:hypothetical protein [Catenulispora sp.]